MIVAVVASKPASTGQAKHFSRIQVGAQIDGEIEAIRPEPTLQRIQIVPG
jgi:hypothetical protein